MTLAANAASVTVRVPGKINLELAVGPLREDGYHELSTVFHAVSVYDQVTVTPAEDWSVQVSGPQADLVPTDASNIAVRAAQLLLQHAEEDGRADLGPVAIGIEKQIPVAGGMAGGSADAAATLVACRELWGLDLDIDALSELAAELGSDVPFLLHGGTAIGSGRGERVTPVLARGELHWVLWAGEGLTLSTPEVYRECDRLREESAAEVDAPEPSGELVAALRRMETDEVAAALRNDLQAAAVSLRPVLAEALESGLELGARGGLVSGSGPTVAFLVGSAAEAIDLSVGLAARGPAGEVVRVVGPVPGAQVVSRPGGGRPTPATMTAHVSGHPAGTGLGPTVL